MEKVEDLLVRIKPRKKPLARNGKRKNSIPPALRRRLIELLKEASAPVVAYSEDIEAMRKAAAKVTRAKLQEAIELLEE